MPLWLIPERQDEVAITEKKDEVAIMDQTTKKGPTTTSGRDQ